ncbi:MAG: hypothetical protein K8T91_24960 [Planctomycetes bacterium]|nr:hypothetical protein [Planctomycetota bacterium]
MVLRNKTTSEVLFERFCTEVSIPFTAIPCEEGSTPDYELLFGSLKVIAEIKQLDLNPADKAVLSELRSRGSASAWGGTEQRWAKKIKRANKQLKAKCALGVPGLAVCFDNGTSGGTDPIDIKEAMFGKETVRIWQGSHGEEGFSPIYAGEGGVLTANSNTTISAIAVLWSSRPGCILSLFHNHFAANPLNPDLLRHERVRHCRLSDECYEWVGF